MANNVKILLASPRGFCAGVDRAIEIVEKTLKKYGAPVYVRHEIVHNKQVVENLKELDRENLLEHKAFQKQVGTLEDSWVKKELSGLSSREIIELKKFVLKEKLNYKTFQHFQQDDDYILQGWDKLEGEALDAKYEDWIKKDFGHLDGADGIVFHSVAADIQRMVETRRTITQGKANVSALSAEELNFKTKTASFLKPLLIKTFSELLFNS